MRELGFGLLLVASLTLGCGKYGPPLRNLPPEPTPEALPTPEAAAPEAAAPQETAPEAAAPAEAPAEPSAP
ncbi:MAG: hypothetical protein JRH01_03250 [Deltaproteobacteria bacterium]|nr:hypothetical protein [Deltaproteobacteria bacterium]